MSSNYSIPTPTGLSQPVLSAAGYADALSEEVLATEAQAACADWADWLIIEQHLDRVRNLVRHLRRQFSAGETLRTTVVVHDVFVQLVDEPLPENDNQRTLAIWSAARELLREAYRKRRRRNQRLARRALEGVDVPSSGEDPTWKIDLFLQIEVLRDVDPTLAQIAESKLLIGLTAESDEEPLAELLALTPHQLRAKWAAARAWLRVRYGRSDQES